MQHGGNTGTHSLELDRNVIVRLGVGYKFLTIPLHHTFVEKKKTVLKLSDFCGTETSEEDIFDIRHLLHLLCLVLCAGSEHGRERGKAFLKPATLTRDF